MASEKHSAVVQEVAKSSGVDEQHVRAVLEHLGLERALEEVHSLGIHEKVSASDAKIAFRLGRNTIAV